MATSNLSNPSEIWKPVPGYEGFYSVSNRGRVRREKTTTCTRAGKILKQVERGNGYLFVQLSKEGVARSHNTHRLVAAAFLGQCPDGCEVNHKDGEKQNNHVSNLEYVDSSANQQHAYDHGLQDASGENNGRARLTEEAVREMRRQANAPMSVCRELAAKYSVGASHVVRIMRGDRWAHLPYREDEFVRAPRSERLGQYGPEGFKPTEFTAFTYARNASECFRCAESLSEADGVHRWRGRNEQTGTRQSIYFCDECHDEIYED